ncbi:MAG TPA: acetyl-CoA carboxylase biotin carboxylase subunit [Actinomycetota bacterium]|nr:acetyl-CoA carboxylase biotin carboxylase subunit [Actinomycetota bacterium]
MFSKVLVANRGEIAIRVFRALREMGIGSVAVYSEADRDAMHTAYADEAILLGPAAAAESYLNIDKILDAAERTGAEAIHPGYGFLAENENFAQAIEDAGLVWVGPPPSAIVTMGDKVSARQAAVKAGAPVVPGTIDPITDPAEIRAFAEEHGLPIAIKASFGGGGRGFKVVRTMEEMEDALGSAQREAAMSFGRDEVYLERYLEGAKHIEAQIVADKHGNVLFFGERECSMQRRHQKLVEEAPSPVLTPEVRERLREACVAICKQVGYVNAGTVETLLDADRERFYFMEMNTRLQVEHPVTEMVTGVDLAKLQILVAAGEKLPLTQDQIQMRGHAIEVRVNAEDPSKKFMPSPGRIGRYRVPTGPGVRVDSGFGENTEISRFYDSLVAKLIVWAEDRDAARMRMVRAIDEYVIEGIKTTLPFHRIAMTDPGFASGEYSTSYVETEMDLSGLKKSEPAAKVAAPDAPDARTLTVEVNGKRFEVRVDGLGAAGTTAAAATPAGGKPSAPVAESAAVHGGGGAMDVVAPMQGTIVKTVVEAGATVKAGDLLIVLEAMKMENHITAPRDGTVASLSVKPGQNVEGGAVVAVIE